MTEVIAAKKATACAGDRVYAGPSITLRGCSVLARLETRFIPNQRAGDSGISARTRRMTCRLLVLRMFSMLTPFANSGIRVQTRVCACQALE